ncbi:phospholipase D-like domain-containing protein [Solimicrobium silvestre]|uniref:Phosphatidylserine/phosphatidylglycerophosphate/ cardiolipin synthase n=1 Tax=Solimicrobium silvestre TaxID=2099400 RepID=A0A2S9H0R4_9BURK|nr:phospholipase D-like domain-containing protein [Solimicrobium silvestre]PRC93574.1 Phosphatidylserine/phosphatidylglycerophosphate/cardiolipin synthase [Solimicrobium silvestre]
MGLQRNVIFTEQNQLTLLNSGGEFFPALISAIDSAQVEIYLETYLFSEDITGKLVHDALCRAAQRHVSVYVIVDWLGTGNTRSAELGRSFTACGVQFRRFNPWFRRGFARTHRKLFVADQRLAIIGGININHDLFAEGEHKRTLPFPRWDFATSVSGPLVAEIHQLMSDQWKKVGKLDWLKRLELLTAKKAATAQPRAPIVAGLAPRDNFLYRRTIQKAYLYALGNARHQAIIATPYFAPGRKFRNALISAARRGVQVTLLIGCGDFRLQDAVAHSYYPKLLKHGVQIVEYRKSQLHAKVAVVDNEWATIGSCNCDGLSLFINQEANILIKDHEFSSQLSAAILQGVADGVKINLADYENISWQRKFWYGCSFFIYSSIIRLIAVEDFM